METLQNGENGPNGDVDTANAATAVKMERPASSDATSASSEQASTEDVKDTTQELYCICRRPYEVRVFMIECEECHSWLHGQCIGLLEADAARIARYVCPSCTTADVATEYKANTRQSRRTHSVCNYAEVENGIHVQEHRYTRELDARPFGELMLPEMDARDLTRSWACSSQYVRPVLFPHPDGLDMVMPPPSFDVDDVVNSVGGSRPMNVIEVATQQEIEGYNLYQFAYYFKHPSVRRKTLNVISLEVTGTPLADQIVRPKLARELDWVDRVWPADDDQFRPKVQLYCLMGVSGCYTDFHIDFGGSSVFYHVVRGEKIFYFIPPTPLNLATYGRRINSPPQNDVFFTDMLPPGSCQRCRITTGQTLFIPSGWIHAVFTPVDTLVFGGNFLHDAAIPMQIDISRIEARTHIPARFRFPFIRRAHWYAARDLADRLERGAAHPRGALLSAELEGIPRLVRYLANVLDRKGEAAFLNLDATAQEAVKEDADHLRADEMPRALYGKGAALIDRLRRAFNAMNVERAMAESELIAVPGEEGPADAEEEEEGGRRTKRRRRSRAKGSPAKKTKANGKEMEVGDEKDDKNIEKNDIEEEAPSAEEKMEAEQFSEPKMESMQSSAVEKQAESTAL